MDAEEMKTWTGWDKAFTVVISMGLGFLVGSAIGINVGEVKGRYEELKRLAEAKP